MRKTISSYDYQMKLKQIHRLKFEKTKVISNHINDLNNMLFGRFHDSRTCEVAPPRWFRKLAQINNSLV